MDAVEQAAAEQQLRLQLQDRARPLPTHREPRRLPAPQDDGVDDVLEPSSVAAISCASCRAAKAAPRGTSGARIGQRKQPVPGGDVAAGPNGKTEPAQPAAAIATHAAAAPQMQRAAIAPIHQASNGSATTSMAPAARPSRRRRGNDTGKRNDCPCDQRDLAGDAVLPVPPPARQQTSRGRRPRRSQPRSPPRPCAEVTSVTAAACGKERSGQHDSRSAGDGTGGRSRPSDRRMHQTFATGGRSRQAIKRIWPLIELNSTHSHLVVTALLRRPLLLMPKLASSV